MKRLRVAHIRFLIPFVVVAWRASEPIGDNSFLWHVRAGTAQLDAGAVLTADPFSFTASGVAWRTQSWLAELAYGWLENVTGGLGWVPPMKFLAISLVLVMLGLVMNKLNPGRSAFVVAGMFVLLWLSIPYGVARPALLGAAILATVVAMVHMERRPLWVLPPLFWLWASVHGMFVVGLGYVFLDALRRRSKRQVVAVAIAGLATAFSAHGIGTWGTLLQFTRNRGALDLISEWGPPDFSSVFMLPFLLAIVGLVVAGVRGVLVKADLWVAIPFLAFGLLAERNIWPAAIALAPLAFLAVSGLATRERRAGSESFVINWAIAVVLIGAGVAGLARSAELSDSRFPSQETIARLEPGRVFAGSAVGGYLIYSEWPERTVFIDDRAELYGEEGFQRFVDLLDGIGVEEVFAELEIDQALLRSDWPVVGMLRLLGWESRHQDDNFVLMARS